MTGRSKSGSPEPPASATPAGRDRLASQLREVHDDIQERDRVRAFYDMYASDPALVRIWSDAPSVDHIRARKWAAIRTMVANLAPNLRMRRILDLGAWNGEDTLHLHDLAGGTAVVVALDLLEFPLRKAQQVARPLACVVGHASRLPFRAGAVDLVYQSTMLSSVLAPERRAAILAEVRRVLIPGGLFLSFDIRYPNPWNPHVRRVSHRELRAGFARWPARALTTTLLPPLLRRLAPLSRPACTLLETVPVLRSHLLFGARKPDDAGPDDAGADDVGAVGPRRGR